MSIEKIRDEGQTLGSPAGKVLGIVDSREDCEKVAEALAAVGIPKVRVLVGDDGIQLLERVNQFFFSDMEDRVLRRHLEELRAGHAVAVIDAPSEQIDEVVRVASANGARRLVHFGMLTVSWLSE